MTTQAVKQRRASTIFQDLVWVAADVGGALPKSVLQPVSPVTASNSYIEWYFTLYIYTAPVTQLLVNSSCSWLESHRSCAPE